MSVQNEFERVIEELREAAQRIVREGHAVADQVEGVPAALNGHLDGVDEPLRDRLVGPVELEAARISRELRNAIDQVAKSLEDRIRRTDEEMRRDR